MRFIYFFLFFLIFFLSCGKTEEKPPYDCNKMEAQDNIEHLITDIKSNNFHENVEFIYKGEDKIQCLEEDIIKSDKVAILRGKVLNEANESIKSVKITINNYDEYGFTYTRSNGEFDLAVNNSQDYTIVYQKKGYITIQRSIVSRIHDFSKNDDVVMIKYDDKVTTIDLSKISEIAAAKASLVEDSDGKRENVLFFSPQTEAKAILQDGTEVNLNKISVRATEFTVGENGPKRMPAELPASSGYTYAVELSIDEAIEKNAKRIEFSKPVFNYVDNFIGFPIGGIVPVGYYDKEKSEWIASENGKVIKIISIDNNKAQVDTIGDGIADNIDMNDDELTKLASIYDVNKSLWRVKLTHFTSLDYNWPVGCSNCPPPDLKDKTKCNPCQKSGSIINIQTRTLGEVLPIAGTGFTLEYNSSRVNGYKGFNKLDIKPRLDANTENFIKGTLEINIAGEKEIIESDDVMDLSFSYLWDGKDTYGRVIEGNLLPIKVDIAYYYKAVYMEPSETAESFAKLSDNDESLDISREMGRIKFKKSKIYYLGNEDIRRQKLGGWDFGVHYQLAANNKVFYKVSSSGTNGGLIRKIIERDYSILTNIKEDFESVDSFVGGTLINENFYYKGHRDGNLYRYNLETKETTRVITASDDVMYIDKMLEHNNELYVLKGASICKIDLNTFIFEDIVTPDTFSFKLIDYLGEAKDFQLKVNDFAISKSGNIYIIDKTQKRVFQIDTNKNLEMIIGEKYISQVIHGIEYLENINVSDNENIYLTNYSGRSIIKIAPNKEIFHLTEKIGGSINWGPGRDYNNKYLKETGIDVSNLIINPQTEEVYFISNDKKTIYKIEESGLMNRLNLFDDKQEITDIPIGESRYLNNVFLNSYSDSLQIKDNKMYFINADEIMKIDLSNNPKIPSEDGSEIYYFDENGKHIKTVDSIMGIDLLNFKYNEDGYLILILDKNNNETKIVRDEENYATKIVAHFGQVTLLDINKTTGYLESLTLPMARTYRMRYETGEKEGLLSSFKKPNLAASTFTYDNLGMLVKDSDALDGFSKLTKTENNLETTVEVETAMGRKSKYLTGYDEDLNIYLENNGPTGNKIKTVYSNEDYTIETTRPNGMKLIIDKKPSTRFGKGGEEISNIKAVFPSGREIEISSSTEIVADNKPSGTETTLGNLDIKEITTETTVNRRVVKKHYDNVDRILTTTSPMGRSEKTYFNEKGKVIKVESHGASEGENMVSPSLSPVLYKYDYNGRLTKITQKDRFVEFSYNEEGYLETVIDNMDNIEEYIYDEAGRVILTRTNGESSRASDSEPILYEYDVDDNISKITPQAGKDHGFMYDKLDRVTLYTSPEGGDEESRTTFYSYNPDGQQTETQTPDVNRIKYNYDDSTSVLKSISYVAPRPPEGGVDSQVKYINYNYHNTTDQLIGIELDHNILFYEYDGGLLLSEASSIYDSKVEWKYDDDLRVSEILVNGETENYHTKYRYNPDNQVTEAGQMSYYYDDNGFLTKSILRESGPQTSPVNTYEFNDYGEVTKVKTVIAPEREYRQDIYELDYEYDGIGKIKAITETRKPDVDEDAVIEKIEYFYDMQGRIERVKKGKNMVLPVLVEEYSYDANGNRLTANFDSAQSPVVATYDAQDRMLTYGDNVYTYTVNGALLTKTRTLSGAETPLVTEYSYDAMGNLLKVKLPDNRVVTYQIDARGRRIGKKINGVFKYGFIYGDQLNPIAKVDEAGVILERYVYGLKSNVPEYVVKEGKWYKIVSNHLGSPVMIVDFDNSVVVKEFKYDSFGNVIEAKGDFEIPFRFAGGIWDEDTKLTRFGVRDYDGETGRWTDKEPLGFGGARNFYVYAHSDGVNYVDLDGLFWKHWGEGTFLGTFGNYLGKSISNHFKTPNEVINSDNVLGVSLGRKYLKKWKDPCVAWDKADKDRMKLKKYSEELRNAEHYLWAYKQVKLGNRSWVIMNLLTFGYYTYKATSNLLGYLPSSIYRDPFWLSRATLDQYLAGIAGANDATGDK